MSMTLVLAAAAPSYIAVPADQIAFVDLSNLRLHRVPRQALAPPDTPVQQLVYDPQQFQQYTKQGLFIICSIAVLPILMHSTR